MRISLLRTPSNFAVLCVHNDLDISLVGKSATIPVADTAQFFQPLLKLKNCGGFPGLQIFLNNDK